MRRTGGTDGARTFRGADSALVAPRYPVPALANLSLSSCSFVLAHCFAPKRQRSLSRLNSTRPSQVRRHVDCARPHPGHLAPLPDLRSRVDQGRLDPRLRRHDGELRRLGRRAVEGVLPCVDSSLFFASPHAHRLTRSRTRARRALRDQGRVGRHRVRPARPHGALLGFHRLVRRHRREFVPRRARRLDLATA